MLGLESGFQSADTAVISEQDILGDRLVRPRRAARRPENFIAEATSLAAGDLVVHVDHGIGRFVGLRAIEAAGAPHDRLKFSTPAGASSSYRSRTWNCYRATAEKTGRSISTGWAASRGRHEGRG